MVGEKVKEPAKSALAIGTLYSNFVAANSAKPMIKKKGWEKPMQDFVKLNVDAAFYAGDLCGSIGAIIRDSQGSFIAASSSRLITPLMHYRLKHWP
jgi:hypothetical protein